MPMKRNEFVKDAEIILAVLLVVMIAKYFFMPDILNWIAGYDVYNSTCDVMIGNIDTMTVAGIAVPDLCHNLRVVLFAGIIIDALIMTLLFAFGKEKKKKGKKK